MEDLPPSMAPQMIESRSFLVFFTKLAIPHLHDYASCFSPNRIYVYKQLQIQMTKCTFPRVFHQNV